MPVDGELEKASQLQTRTIPVDDVLNALPPDPAVGIIILDACRDNPLARSLAKALPVSRSTSMGAGLAPVQANGQSHNAGGLLIAYATDPGAVAYDGKEAHSPYTTALARHLATPGLEIQSALTRVRAEVSEATNGAQRPWHNASLAREVFIGGDAPVAKPAPSEQPVAGTSQPIRRQRGCRLDRRTEIVGRGVEAQHGRALRALSVAIPAGPLRQCRAPQPRPAEGSRGVGRPTGADTAGTQMASASQSRTAVGVSDELRQTPGTPATEGQLNLDKSARIDLQLRLSALGHSIGTFDGSLGPRSRAAIGAWQRQSGIVETTYLTPQQHMFLVVQTDPMMAQVRAAVREQQGRRPEAPAGAEGGPHRQDHQEDADRQQLDPQEEDTQTANDDIPYKRRTGTRVDNGDSGVGTFVGGALLGPRSA